ncbi:MLO-LIKE PROTEIN 1 [Salix viminalis]|uniref:MLO-like protein n=1 Tax=Salix viminalis TaxID=40686 RepID=A0A9Q0TPQ7_SALVM|nr:MLO-LIKE PROTEIN 1 [Salix viminalis]
MGEETVLIRQGRSLVETPTYSVATVITVLVFVCFAFQRSIYRFGKWLKKTRRKALFVSLEKIKEELMLLGLISLLLAQCARWISEICVDSSLFSSKFYICSEEDYGITQNFFCLTVGLAMSKIYSWRKWENQINLVADENLQAKKNKVMRRQSTFVFHHTSHPWSRSRVLIWMLCFFRQFTSSIKKSDYLALRLGFITKHRLPTSYNFHKYMVRSMEDEFQGILGISWPLWGYAIICIFINIHGLNIYFWLSFVPAIIVMLVGTKLHHVVSTLALEIGEQTGPSIGTQVEPRDGLFWFGKPEILLRLIQFIMFQNAFEMATFIWSLWGFQQRSCFMKNHFMIIVRLASGVLVQFWCSYSTVPLNVIITQMGSRFKKALVSESVRDSLHSWCKRVKERSKRDSAALSVATRSVCSLDTTVDEQDEITVASGSLSRSSSLGSVNEVVVTTPHEQEEAEEDGETLNPHQDHHQLSLRIVEYLNDTTMQPPPFTDEDDEEEESRPETLLELFRRN